MITPVQEVMTKHLTAISTQSLVSEAYELMMDQRIRHLPVTDSENRIVGVLSQRDLMSAIEAGDLPVVEVMSSPVECVDEKTPLRQAILHILEKKISSLLVVNAQQEVVGIVTTDDLLWELAHLLSNEADEKPILTASEQQTIGQIANGLANMGI